MLRQAFSSLNPRKRPHRPLPSAYPPPQPRSRFSLSAVIHSSLVRSGSKSHKDRPATLGTHSLDTMAEAGELPPPKSPKPAGGSAVSLADGDERSADLLRAGSTCSEPINCRVSAIAVGDVPLHRAHSAGTSTDSIMSASSDSFKWNVDAQARGDDGDVSSSAESDEVGIALASSGLYCDTMLVIVRRGQFD
jgi:hypothetical protein